LSTPAYLASGPDGNIWFTDSSGAVGKITTNGAITEYTSGLNSGSIPEDLAAGPDGNLWFTDQGTTKAIGKITTSGNITEYGADLPTGSKPQFIAEGPDGNLWINDLGTAAIGEFHLNTDTVTEFTAGLNPGSHPAAVAAGPDGNMWFTDSGTSPAIGQFGVGVCGGSSLQGCNLQDASLNSILLSGADLQDANLQNATLENAQLIGANLEGTNLQDADLTGADLEGANLAGANLQNANITNANLNGTNLQGTILPPQCVAEFDPYKQSMAFLQECGVATYPRASTSRRPDGGTAYSYDVNGSTVTYLVPPPSYDPERATSQQLAEYGAPPRPASGHGRAVWDAQQSKRYWVVPPPFLAASRVTGQTDWDATISNWAGYLAWPGMNYSSSVAVWTEPTLGTTDCSDAYEVQWTGLGGTNFNSDGTTSGDDQYLEQDGTSAGAPGILPDQSWYEIVPEPDPGAITTDLYATPGQDFWAGTYYTGGDTFQFTMQNLYTGASTTIDQDAIYDGVQNYGLDTAEAIVERPTINGVLAPLANFGTLSFYDVLANDEPIDNYVNADVTMAVPPSGPPFATVSDLGTDGQSFTSTWQSCDGS
jgi:hypothetical protein